MKFGVFGIAGFRDVNLKNINIYLCIDKYLFAFEGMGRRNILDAFWFGWLCWFCVPGAFVDVAHAYW